MRTITLTALLALLALVALGALAAEPEIKKVPCDQCSATGIPLTVPLGGSSSWSAERKIKPGDKILTADCAHCAATEFIYVLPGGKYYGPGATELQIKLFDARRAVKADEWRLEKIEKSLKTVKDTLAADQEKLKALEKQQAEADAKKQLEEAKPKTAEPK